MVSVHVVAPGETVQTIARDHGFRQWKRVWEHPDNAELRKLRPNPNVLAPGDEITVPDLEAKSELVHVDKRTVFVVPPTKRELVLDLRGSGDVSLAGTPYELRVDGEAHSGIVDPRGRVRHEIPIEARNGTLTLTIDDDTEIELELKIGFLQPVSTDEGLRARLFNLGFVHAGDDSEAPPELEDAMKRFREHNELPPREDPLSESAREDLLFVHGS